MAAATTQWATIRSIKWPEHWLLVCRSAEAIFGGGPNATNNVYETAILDHLGPIAQRDWCIFDDDGQADNKTRGCRSDHYFSQDLNQGGVLGVLSATHCALCAAVMKPKTEKSLGMISVCHQPPPPPLTKTISSSALMIFWWDYIFATYLSGHLIWNSDLLGL